MSDPQLIEQLLHADPQKRIEAIHALVAMDDFSAMEYLKSVYYNDVHPDVREEARLAGLELRGRHNPTGFEGVPRPEPLPLTRNRRSTVGTGPYRVPDNRERNASTIVWQDLIPYVLAFTVIGIVGLFITITSFIDSIEPILTELETTIRNDPELAGVYGDFDWRSIVDSNIGLLASIFSGILMTATFLIECYIINYMAIDNFKGRGGFFDFIRNFTLANIAIGLVFWTLTVLFASQFGDFILTAVQYSAQPDTTTNTFGSTVIALSCGFFFAFIGFCIYQSRVIARSYQITVLNGFICLAVGYIGAQIAGQFLSLFVSPFIPGL